MTKTMKIIRSKNKDMKPKYTQTGFAYMEHMGESRRPEPKYTPPRPHEMTDAELEKWYIANPSERLKSEILARIKKGVEFPHFRVVRYLRHKPQLVPVFHNE